MNVVEEQQYIVNSITISVSHLISINNSSSIFFLVIYSYFLEMEIFYDEEEIPMNLVWKYTKYLPYS